MFYVLECVTQKHDPTLVALALIIWMIGGTSLFLLMRRAQESNRRRQRQWIAIAAVSAGVAVWGTHFVAMLSYDGGVPFTFEIPLTVVSVLVAIVLFWVALQAYFKLNTPYNPLISGTLLAFAIAGMHFTGMAAIDAAAVVNYDLSMIVWGQIVASLAAVAAFYVFDKMPGRRGIMVAMALSLIAVGAMHFTAMSATQLIPDPTRAAVNDSDSRQLMIAMTVSASIMLALIALGTSFVDRYLNDLRGLVDASLDAIAILRDGTVIDANDRFLTLVGARRDMVIGSEIAKIVVAQDGMPLAALSKTATEGQLTQSNGEMRPVEIAAHVIEYRGRDCQVISIRDLTRIKESQRRITHLAKHDSLTNLPNRATAMQAMSQAMEMAALNGEQIAVLALDLDRFKAVNDIFGHQEGDRVLCQVADYLRTAVRSTDLVARLGGDEFVIIQTGASQPQGAKALADRIIAIFARDQAEAKKLRTVGTSIGIAVFPNDAADPSSLHHAADLALYRAKAAGRGTVCAYDVAMDNEQQQRRELEHDMTQAIARGEFWLAYQPLVNSQSRAVTGYEALLRWDHPRLGAVPPDRFIPLAEETGAIISIGEWVLQEACRQAATWPDDLRIAVNVSAVQFWVPNLVDTVRNALSISGLDPHRLELEITESVVMRDNDSVVATLDELRELGVSIVMDDFGTGFSSLSNLKSYAFDKIKIDRSFIATIDRDTSSRAIMRAIVGLGHSMNLPVVAEGVETEEQLHLVALEGCVQVQGYLFGRPSVAPAFETRQVSAIVGA
ncbi:EAL domain-containing protein [Ketogulonicigenium robustum]|nr:EAL domain-containing protein [Ketogulonicigenium robustum]